MALAIVAACCCCWYACVSDRRCASGVVSGVEVVVAVFDIAVADAGAGAEGDVVVDGTAVGGTSPILSSFESVFAPPTSGT